MNLSLEEQWQHAADEAGKVAVLKQFSGINVPVSHGMFGCSLAELDTVAGRAGFSMIWIRGSTHGAADEPDGTWRRAACVSERFSSLHPARSVHVAKLSGWDDAPRQLVSGASDTAPE